MFKGQKFFVRSIGYGERGGVNFLKLVAGTITMDTSTDYMSALNMPLGIFLDCYNTLSYISEKRDEDMKKSMEAMKNKK
jgi:hypothetical protein